MDSPIAVIIYLLSFPGLLSYNDYVIRLKEFHSNYLQPHVMDHLHRKACIENMMMKAAVLNIPS